MATMEAIDTQYLEADAASVTFASIPQTYKHLQLRGSHRNTHRVGGTALWVRLGGNGSIQTGSIYNTHMAWGYSSLTYGYGSVGQTKFHISDGINGTGGTGTNLHAYDYGSFMFDICDYTSTDHDAAVSFMSCSSLTHGDRRMLYGTGYWGTSYAVTDIQILPSSYNLTRGSEYTLYGIKDS